MIKQEHFAFPPRRNHERLAPWAVDPHAEAIAMIADEQRRIMQVKADFIDQIINQYAVSGDRVSLYPRRDGTGRELIVNGEVRGIFLHAKDELVFRAVK